MSYSKTHKERIKQYVQEVKAIPCKDCGIYKPGEMTFDHLPEYEKKFDLANAKHHSMKAVMAEIAKCEVCCRECHDKREYVRGTFKRQTPNKKKERNRRKRQKWRRNKKLRKLQESREK